MPLSQIERRRILPGTTTTDDVRWAFRILLTRELTDPVKLERFRLSNRTLLALHRRLISSPEFNSEKRRNRAATTWLDATMVQWCYRLLRFEAMPEDEAHQLAALHGTLLALVTDLLAAPDYDTIIEQNRRRDAAGLRRIYAKAMPRSGHHLLVNILCEYFGATLHYCEHYNGGYYCCHGLPCRRAYAPLLDNQLFMQKSHDFDFNDPKDLPGIYVIQFRHPIPRMQSNFDHNVHVTGNEDTEQRFRSFAQSEARYFIRFWKKWMQQPPSNAFLLSYEDLTEHPRNALRHMLHFIQPDQKIDEDTLSHALSLMQVPSGSSLQHTNFALRKVESYRYFNKALYQEIEEQVFETCPGLPLRRLFSS